MSEYERRLRDAQKAYLNTSIRTIREAASNYCVKYETLRVHSHLLESQSIVVVACGC